MAQASLIQVRVDEDLKKEVDALFSDLGLDTPTAIRIFLKKALKWNGMPFEVREFSPNAETILAMEESDRMLKDPRAKTYENVDQMMAELLSDV